PAALDRELRAGRVVLGRVVRVHEAHVDDLRPRDERDRKAAPGLDAETLRGAAGYDRPPVRRGLDGPAERYGDRATDRRPDLGVTGHEEHTDVDLGEEGRSVARLRARREDLERLAAGVDPAVLEERDVVGEQVARNASPFHQGCEPFRGISPS